MKSHYGTTTFAMLVTLCCLLLLSGCTLYIDPERVRATPTAPAVTALAVGESWEKEGIRITLEAMHYGSGRILLDWLVENVGDEEVRLDFFEENFSAVERNNQPLRPPQFAGCIPVDVVLAPQEGFRSGVDTGCPLSIFVDTTPGTTNEAIVTVRNIEVVGQAQWLIPVDPANR